MKLSLGRLTRLALAGIMAMGVLRSAPANAATSRLTVSTFARPGLRLGGILWTGNRFLYLSEGGKDIDAGDAGGHTLKTLATVPANGGEMRCILSPAAHGFPAGVLYCHASANQIYQVSLDGRRVNLFARLPISQGSDGALAYDAGGAFGYRLLAATGGSDAGSGGTVFAIGANHSVSKVGTYAGPGGAENAIMAPLGFGPAAGDLLLSIDKHDHQGRLLAMDHTGATRVLVGGLAWGLNPMAVISAPTGHAAAASPGMYIADWYSHNVLFISAAELQPYMGDLFIGTERRGQLSIVKPSASGHYQAISLSTDLHQPDYNFEGAVYVGD